MDLCLLQLQLGQPYIAGFGVVMGISAVDDPVSHWRSWSCLGDELHAQLRGVVSRPSVSREQEMSRESGLCGSHRLRLGPTASVAFFFSRGQPAQNERNSDMVHAGVPSRETLVISQLQFSSSRFCNNVC